MTRQAKLYSAAALADTALPLATETVVATITAVRGMFENALVRFIGIVCILGGVGATTLTLRVRRDSLVGAVVGETVTTPLAGVALVIGTIGVEEQRLGEIDATYVLTATTGGGASTCNTAELIALVS